MKNRKLPVLAAIAAISIGFTSNAHAGPVKQLPNTYTTGGKTFSNLNGFTFEFFVKDVDFVIPSMTNFKLDCEMLNVSGFSYEHSSCVNTAVKPDCFDAYANKTFAPSRRSELVPIMAATEHADVQKAGNPNKNITTINLGFFDTDAFPGRPGSATWKPIYQEPCSLNLGSYRSNNANQFYSDWYDREIFGGQVDKQFGTIRIRSDKTLYVSQTADIDHTALSGDAFIPGVVLRYGGVDTSPTNWPAFVIDKKDNAVGRTAIGINGASPQAMKILVVQPGRDGNYTGLTIADVKRFFNPSQWPTVVLLDGSGSSQLATTSTVQVPSGTQGLRTACNSSSHVKACTIHGDVVDNWAVSHWLPTDKVVKAGTTKSYVDRKVPNTLVIKH